MKTREYHSLPCNDRAVILAAALRRGFAEMLAFACSPPPPSAEYRPLSFQAIIGYANALQAAYLDHLPRKFRQRLLERAADISLASLRDHISQLLQSDADQVTCARLGVSLAALLISNAFEELADQHFTAGDTDDDYNEDAEIVASEAIAALATHQYTADNLLSDAARSVVSAIRPDLASLHLEIISHDLSAPLILIGPSPPLRLVGASALTAQIPSAGAEIIRNRLGSIMDDVAQRMLDQRDDAH